jgi:hypothetical protein
VGGAGHRDAGNEGFSTIPMRRDRNGELYNVVFNCENVRLNSYSDDTIQNRVKSFNSLNEVFNPRIKNYRLFVISSGN